MCLFSGIKGEMLECWVKMCGFQFGRKIKTVHFHQWAVARRIKPLSTNSSFFWHQSYSPNCKKLPQIDYLRYKCHPHVLRHGCINVNSLPSLLFSEVKLNVTGWLNEDFLCSQIKSFSVLVPVMSGFWLESCQVSVWKKFVWEVGTLDLQDMVWRVISY